MGTSYGAGTPLPVSQQSVFGGLDRTNGFLMRNSDGRVSAIKEGFSRLSAGAANVLYAVGAVPYGNALFRDTATIAALPGQVQTDKPTKAWLVGVLEFDQGNQAGNPILGWGLQTFQKGTLVRDGLVGYKQTMAAVGQEANYLALLQEGIGGVHDVGTVRKVYADWVAALAFAADGDRLGLFFGNASGFPIMAVVAAADVAAPALTGATFGGWVKHLEPENQAVYVSIKA